MKRIYILLIIFLLITGCNVTKELKYKTYDLNYQEELNGKYEIIKDYNLYEKLLMTRNINKSYDQDFFESSFLIAVYVDEICNESPTSVSRFKIFDGNLELYLKSSLMGITGEIKTKLFLLELESSYLNKFETVKIFKNDQEIKKENYEFSYNFIACGIANNKFDGKTDDETGTVYDNGNDPTNGDESGGGGDKDKRNYAEENADKQLEALDRVRETNDREAELIGKLPEEI
jgi:hypothetical protein